MAIEPGLDPLRETKWMGGRKRSAEPLQGDLWQQLSEALQKPCHQVDSHAFTHAWRPIFTRSSGCGCGVELLPMRDEHIAVVAPASRNRW
jgi:hypothetical protein